MYLSRHILISLPFAVLLLVASSVKAQLGYNLEIKKPEPYENRELRAEKSGRKKFTKPKHFFQNTYTHYNYFFNANNKLNEVIARAKEENKDNYDSLLSFYNYSLETTAQDNTQLDSIIYKAKTGIVMHDLRNDWIDDLYLLWGASYFLQQKFDSAYQMFQFINYAFAEKEKDGYYRYIGSRMDGNSALSIATKEDDGLVKRMISDPPSRNNAFIWQIRTLMEANAMPEAATLISTLKKDPNFPERLRTSLEEVQAFWFYKQQQWDSAATHLVNALPNAENKRERGRWEYLIAQLYEKANKSKLAEEYFTKSIAHTTDPVMDVYARLNLIRINKEGGDDYINRNIDELVKMAKRERYADYRDIIYYMAAQMELERNNLAAAQEYFLKGAKYSNNTMPSHSRSFLKLADLSFAQKNYEAAASYYDSIQTADLTPAETERINQRKEALAKIVVHLQKLNRQDSLQRIAAMPEQERTDYLKKLARQLRRQKGLKDEDSTVVVRGNGAGATAAEPNLYNTQSKGEWYFYNATLKRQGLTSFKQNWGNRPNVDNWRRASNVAADLRNASPNNTRGNPAAGAEDATVSAISYEGLLANVPLTAEQIRVSNEVISSSLLALGTAYINEVEDYPSAIKTLEDFRTRFPDYASMSEVLLNLYYSYQKVGDVTKAAEIRSLLLKKYPTSREASIAGTGTDPEAAKPSYAVTKLYESIYDQFIEGRFEEAIAAKQKADSLYKTNYWSPQLLYIEAVYHIRQREDSLAKNTLNTIIQQNANTPLAAKATNLLQVLGRRKQIEEELQNLNIERPQEDTTVITPYVQRPVEVKRDTAVVQNNPVVRNTEPKLRTDSMVTAKPVAPPPAAPSSYSYDPMAQQYVMIVLNKVDNVFGNEAKNAFNRYNKERYYNLPLETQLVPLDADNRLLLIGNFNNVLQATEYVQKAASLAPKEIVPWLKAEKYSFTIISQKNLEILKTKPDLGLYKKFLEQSAGLKF